MRKKEPTLIITFFSVTEAMRTEKICRQSGLPGRLVPVPREISSSCGIAWRAAPEDRALLEDKLAEEGVAIQELRVIEI